MSTIKSILIFILIITNLTSCTSMLWKKNSYIDKFKNVLNTKDGEKIVILGKKYHYIFNDDSLVLNKLLDWENNSKLEIEKYNIRITENNKIIGSIILKTKVEKNLNNALDEQDKSFLQTLGFQNSGSNQAILKKKIIVSGVRYAPKSDANYDTTSTSNKEFKIKVEVDDNFVDIAKKIAFTPVTVLADGVMITLYFGARLLIDNPCLALPNCKKIY